MLLPSISGVGRSPIKAEARRNSKKDSRKLYTMPVQSYGRNATSIPLSDLAPQQSSRRYLGHLVLASSSVTWSGDAPYKACLGPMS